MIDVGCADGQFYVAHFQAGLFPASTVLDIDANSIYEDSLKAIQNVLGGHYVIAAASDQEGEVELTMSAHPYWSSLRPQSDQYWERLNHLSERTIKVPAVTIDSLAARLGLSGPYLLKLDVQGAEVQALRGARGVLAQTHLVICEADIDDFQAIHQALVEAGFGLFDVAGLNWLPDRSLGWFHPVYLNRALDRVKPRPFWDAAHNRKVLKMQSDRREFILKEVGRMLAEQQALPGKR